MSESFEITQTTKGKLPHLPFVAMKKAVLGSSYVLSLVFIGDKRSQALNKKYRGKDKPTNVLSFALGEKDGEIFINAQEARRGAGEYSLTQEKFIGFLFIHGMLHLKGYRHGSKMNEQEKKLRKKFAL
jgi:probable rRNA maturation factor